MTIFPSTGVDSQNHFVDRVAARIAPLLPAHSSILAGLSGGVDSVVLLHLLHKLAARFSWRLSALHVHHGISPNADAWAEFCAGLCAGHNISLHVEHVDIAPLRAHGIEAAARKLRHAAFAAQECDFVALAHHADDQAETLLLQLLRGAGVKGAAAMPFAKHLFLHTPSHLAREGEAHHPVLLRPLLDVPRTVLLDYARQHGLCWIEDESNADDSYPRNFLRHRVLPLLEQKFPAYRETLARSAQHFAEASELLDDLARLDAPDLSPSPASGRGARGECCTYGDEKQSLLEVARLQALSPPRARNLLRYFLHVRGAPMPQTMQLDDMLQQLCNARKDASVCITYGGYWQVRRYWGKVYALRAPGEFDRSLVLPWHGEEHMDWPALDTRLIFSHTRGAGISLAKLERAPVTMRLRQGGEPLRPQPKAATRTLKNLLQEHHVPPWQRDRLPLLYCGDDLVCVPGVAIAAEYQAVAEEAGISVGLLR